MENYQAVIDRTAVVKRFIVPIQADDPIPGRPRRYGLGPDDFNLVREGRACANCLAAWETVVLPACPVCRAPKAEADLIDEPQEWRDYRAYVQHEIDHPHSTEVPQMHEIVEAIMDEQGGGWRPGVKKNL